MNPRGRPTQRLEDATKVLLFGLAIYLLGRLSYRVAFDPRHNLAVWWAPSGIALAVLVRGERRLVPWLAGAIFVGSALVNVRLSPVVIFFRSVADTAEPLAGAWVLRRWCGPQVRLRTLREVSSFAIAGCLVGPTVGTLIAGLEGTVFNPTVAASATFVLLWWGSAVLGVSLFAPVILSWQWPSHVSRQRWTESLVLALALVGVGVGSFFVPPKSPLMVLVGFAAFPLLAWAAARFGPSGAARSVVMLSVFSLLPVFKGMEGSGPWQVFITQAIYALGGLTSLGLAAVICEVQELRNLAAGEAKTAEESLALLQSALRGAPFGMAFFDLSLRLIRLNDVFARLGRQPETALRGRKLDEAIPELALQLEPLLRSSLRLGHDEELEVRSKHDGKGQLWRASAFPVRGRAGQLHGVGLLLVDETERKAGEEERARLFRAAEEAVRVREDFLSIASHELKTPLTPIFARLGLLQRKLAAGEAITRDMVDKPLQSLRKLTELINDLLDSSRIQFGRLMLHRQPQPLGELVRRSAEPFRQVSPVHQVVIDSGDEPLWADVDPQRLTQVVTNLIDNAIKYSPGGGRIDVRLRPHPDGLELVVSDQGIGIEPEQKERLFERFFRVRGGAGTTGGLGLGLYIARDIVERHGGRIWVESEPGKGSQFHVVLPRILHAELPAALH